MRVALALALLCLFGILHAVCGAKIAQGVAWNRYGMAESELMQDYNSFLESRADSRRSALRAKVSNQGHLTAAPGDRKNNQASAGSQVPPASNPGNQKAANNKNQTPPPKQDAVKSVQSQTDKKSSTGSTTQAPQPIDLSKEFPQLDIFANDPNSPLDISLLPPDLRYPLASLPPLSKCPVPTKIRVRQEPFNSKMNVDRTVLQGLLGEASEFVNREAEVDGQSFSCVDSRKQGAILGTPGGDFGEFLVGLSVMEELSKKPFTDAEVYELLKKWVTWDRKGNYPMYHNTDEASIRRLAKGLHVNGMAGVVNELDIHNPPVELREEILLSLNQTEKQGSHVIKAFLNYPDRFLIRRDLTAALLRAYYKLLWDRSTRMPEPEADILTPFVTLAKKYGQKDTTRPEFVYQRLNLEVYSGALEPRAWISVRSSRNCEILGAAHKFSPKNPVPLSHFPRDSPEAKRAAALAKAAQEAPANEAKANKNKVAEMTATAKALLEASPVAKALGTVDPAELAALGIDHVDYATLFGTDPVMLETEVGLAKADEPMVVTQVLVHHPHAVTVQRKWLSRFFALSYPSAGSQPTVYKQILRRQLAVTELIAEMLGRNTPFYTVTVE